MQKSQGEIDWDLMCYYNIMKYYILLLLDTLGPSKYMPSLT